MKQIKRSVQKQTKSVSMVCLLGLTAGLGSGASAQDYTQDPFYGSVTLASPFYPDPHVLVMQAGGGSSANNASADCRGSVANAPDYQLYFEAGSYPLSFFVDADVDTTIMVNGPRGEWYCNDDSQWLGNFQAGLQLTEPRSGRYDIWVGVYNENDNYAEVRLFISEYSQERWAQLIEEDDESQAVADTSGIYFGDDSGRWANDGECDDPRFRGEGMAASVVSRYRYRDAADCRQLFETRMITLAEEGEPDLITGRLSADDESLDDYGYVDRYTFTGVAGQQALIDLRADGFDSLLLVRTPSGEIFYNDDFEGDFQHSQVLLTARESGEYEVMVTSFSRNSTGTYELLIDNGGPDVTDLPRQLVLNSALDGKVIESGASFALFEFMGEAGNMVDVDMSSNDFDTYLVLVDPLGNEVVNDDYDGSTSRSRISQEVGVTGSYMAIARGYWSDSQGDFRLEITQATPPPPEANIMFGRKNP